MDTTQIQKNIQHQIGHIDKQEQAINNDLNKTEDGIAELKKKKKGYGIVGLIFDPTKWIKLGFIVIGGLILLTLARMAWAAWKKNFMPKSSEVGGLTIFGFQIPFGA